MSPIQPSKRRRLNTATNTLSQPFKSPFKTPLKSKPDTQAPSSSPTNEAPSSPTSSPPTKADHSTTELTSQPPLPRPAPTTTTPLRRTLPHQHTSLSPEYLALQKQHTHLLNHLSAARAALETSNQALKIESSARDRELETLVAKWKGASRAAAEEVFVGVRDKVHRMGGVGAMRERERERMGGSFGWDDNPEVEGGDGGDGDGEDGTGFRGREGEVGAEDVDEREEGARKSELWGEEEDDEEGYTMDLMLRSLNVDLGVIGFDRTLQKWVD